MNKTSPASRSRKQSRKGSTIAINFCGCSKEEAMTFRLRNQGRHYEEGGILGGFCRMHRI